MRNCSEDELIVFSIITSVVMVASVCGNSLLIIVFCKFSSQRTASNVLVMGLVIADSLIPIVFILYLAGTLMPHGSDRCDREQLCKVSAWFSIILISVIILHLMLISVERFIAVKFSLRYHSILTNRRAVMASVAMWLWAVLVTSVFPQALRADENENFEKFVIALYPCGRGNYSQSRVNFASAKAYNTFLFIILLGIPLVTILSSYGYVFVVSRNHRRRINAQDSNPAQLSTIKQEFKVTLILAIVVLLCLLSFLPLFILSIISFQFENTNRDYSDCYFFRLRRCKKYAYLVALGLNAICNPLIYGLGNRRLRVAIRKLLKCNNLDEN
ncbi:trace amine-associated receptor 13c-like [Acropora millepora]|uniref:trace amine-associated receptor 13c-like n=1 Tax=Acropora millepora TaxID=45264 RepID=UPI001CF38E4D|nr:trace amine-associated receptor 13c-like [Acropora millepora]